jgi:YgiT-type zinc finger domain-containing protein
MVAKAEKCPVCGKGTLKSATIHEEMFGVVLGNYPGERCSNCGETFLTSESMGAVEERAKELGLWGLASKVKVVKSGNSLVVRIPAPLAQYLRLRKGQELMVSPDKENRLVLELA